MELNIMENKRIETVYTDEILIKHNRSFLNLDEYINHINIVNIKRPIITNKVLDNQNKLSLTIRQTQSTIQIPEILIYNKNTKEYITDGAYISHEKNIDSSTNDYIIVDFLFDMGNDFSGEKDFNVVFT